MSKTSNYRRVLMSPKLLRRIEKAAGLILDADLKAAVSGSPISPTATQMTDGQIQFCLSTVWATYKAIEGTT